MALRTFRPAKPPAGPTMMKPKFNIKKAEFGDGYTQTTPNGLNHMRYTLTLQWDTLLPFEARLIIAFLEEHQGTIPFHYQPVNSDKARKWTCEDWQDSAEPGGFRKLSATFVESFDLRR
ncbi:phage tail protein [Aureimonas sp. AU40]|uniref:phage tail protein n=1 Tax=Aureimonas sp. AU40 TaxID=1637747 RepID=UPI000781979F|nr:phage tail protein [Aureimonas sp. AU40]